MKSLFGDKILKKMNSLNSDPDKKPEVVVIKRKKIGA